MTTWDDLTKPGDVIEEASDSAYLLRGAPPPAGPLSDEEWRSFYSRAFEPARRRGPSATLRAELSARDARGERPVSTRATLDERAEVVQIDAVTEAELTVNLADEKFGRSKAAAIRQQADRMRAVATGLDAVATRRELEEARARGDKPEASAESVLAMVNLGESDAPHDAGRRCEKCPRAQRRTL